ncbi:hypothetical protein CF392_16085 [Tamilnaduibacter salinus]|uniref:Transposase IS30-like HTH domain-containing protein n=1 Tax=Tamilnaduibacter salinus TaxID=1484056 RepID=A0A2A2I0D6_9GAMM|nr:hypothetical protein CF392_16085 [Tamilnaduibacter salinus]
MPRSYHHLGHADRATIMLMHAEGHSLRAIAERLKRSPSTVSRRGATPYQSRPAL